MSKAHTNGTNNGERQNGSAKSNGVDMGAFQEETSKSNYERRANQQAQMKSNIFQTDNGNAVVDGQSPSKTSKSYVKSSIFDNSNFSEPVTPRRASKFGGNPITGEGYCNENGNEVGQRKDINTPLIQKGRQPPGGRSSQLW